MSRPRLLLIPDFTELEWVIKPRLEEWADVASFDMPGVGGEDLPSGATFESIEPEEVHEAFVQRALEELDRRGWERCFLVSDGGSNGVTAGVVRARPEAVEGVALGHACLSLDMDGGRPPVNRQVWDGMTQLVSTDYRSFVRYGITQLTRGSFGDELAKRMLERFPREFAEVGWRVLYTAPAPIGEALRKLDVPLLFAKHDGCLMFTDEGWEDAVSEFPQARTFVVDQAPAVDDGFAGALREFCEEVIASNAERAKR